MVIGSISTLGSFILGCTVYLSIYNRSAELDLQAPKLSLIYALSITGSALLVWAVSERQSEAILELCLMILGYITGTFVCMILYRASPIGCHRLTGFKGPWLARWSHIYTVLLTVNGWHLYENLQDLHGKYGDYVRIGPNSLSIIDPAAVKAIHGPQSRCSKGPMYDIAHPRHTLHFCRDKQEHASRRRVWRRAVDPKSIACYRLQISECVSQLVEKISRSDGRPINAAKYFNLFSFDAMGLVGFGHSFARLEEGETNRYMDNLHKNTMMAGTFAHMPWVVQILKRIPLFNWQYTSFIAQSQRLAEERIKAMSDKPSMFEPVVAAFKQQAQQSEQDHHNLYGDADLIVVAGSDTIAAALTSAIFCLTQHPEHIEKVRQYLESSKDDASKYIDAIILETLRLHPVISSGLQRVTPPEGLQIGAEMLVPGNVRVQTPSYVMFRDKRSFACPDTFLPQRFSSEGAHLVRDPSVFIPFNTGVYSCIGRQLAMMELNMVLTELIARFDFTLAPGQTESKFLRSKRDTFTLFIKDLDVIFTPTTG